MNSENALEGFRHFANDYGTMVDHLAPLQAINLMIAFYEQVRADDCDEAIGGDMLLFQWGVYDWGEGRSFEYNITRQLIPGLSDDELEVDNDFIGQLRLTLKYTLVPALESINHGNRWCHNLHEIGDFASFITDCAATSAINHLVPATTTLYYGNAE